MNKQKKSDLLFSFWIFLFGFFLEIITSKLFGFNYRCQLGEPKGISWNEVYLNLWKYLCISGIVTLWVYYLKRNINKKKEN